MPISRAPKVWDPNLFSAELAAREYAQQPVTQTDLRDLLATLLELGGQLINAQDARFAGGAKGDALLLSDGAITSGTSAFTSNAATFTELDVGKTIAIYGAGVSNGLLVTTIATFISADAVVLAANASGTTTAAQYVYGTDDTAAIQATIDFVLQLTYKPPVFLPAGGYLTTDSIHTGYGVSGFNSVHLVGAGMKYAGSANYSGTSIHPTKVDRPAIVIQGNRSPRPTGFSIVGWLGPYIDAKQLSLNVSLIDDTVAANWDDPALGGSALDGRYSTYCAIAIDPYSGNQPATHYPAVSYPSFLGTVSQYNKSFSSDVRFQDIYIEGFTTGIAVQPCDADGNGDFSSLTGVYFRKVKWAFSVGNTQSRNVNFNDVKVGIAYTCLTNNQHGRQTGQYGGTITDLSTFDTLYLFQFGSFSAGPLTFNTVYGESMWKIGSVTQTGTTSETSFIFINPQFKFNGHTDARGVPAYVLEGGNSGTFKFIGGWMSKYPSVLGFQPVNTHFDGGIEFIPDSTRTNPYEKYAHNLLGGGVVTPKFRLTSPPQIKISHYNLDTGVKATVPGSTAKWYSDRTVCTPIYATKVVASGVTTTDDLNNPQYSVPASGSTAGQVASKTSGGNTVAIAGLEMTLTFAARTDPTFLVFGPLPGDVIYDEGTGTAFFVHSRSLLVVLATAQNNYKAGALVGFSTTVGAMDIANSRIYTPAKYLQCTLTAASGALASCGVDSAVTGAYDTDIADGDAIMVWADVDAWASIASVIMTGHSAAAGTVTLTAGTGVRAQARRRLAWWARTGPANV